MYTTHVDMIINALLEAPEIPLGPSFIQVILGCSISSMNGNVKEVYICKNAFIFQYNLP